MPNFQIVTAADDDGEQHVLDSVATFPRALARFAALPEAFTIRVPAGVYGNLVQINPHSRTAGQPGGAGGLYVKREGDGFSCYGFDVLARKVAAVLDWLDGKALAPISPADLAAPGTPELYAQWLTVSAAAQEHNRATGARCPAELVPQLVGLEGCRVEVTAPGCERSRFIVGKSTGWLPCHLEIKTRRSSGGCAVYWPEGASVRVLERGVR